MSRLKTSLESLAPMTTTRGSASGKSTLVNGYFVGGLFTLGRSRSEVQRQRTGTERRTVTSPSPGCDKAYAVDQSYGD